MIVESGDYCRWSATQAELMTMERKCLMSELSQATGPSHDLSRPGRGECLWGFGLAIGSVVLARWVVLPLIAWLLSAIGLRRSREEMLGTRHYRAFGWIGFFLGAVYTGAGIYRDQDLRQAYLELTRYKDIDWGRGLAMGAVIAVGWYALNFLCSEKRYDADSVGRDAGEGKSTTPRSGVEKC
jgi:hypothetical protein